ncbi:DUF1559 domain-containing protein [bacterium]|nr:DUF1559 domain-containing protein [bacterium]
MLFSGSHSSEKDHSPRRERAGRGFTLVELLIVVAILAILAAIAVPNLREATRRARTAECASNLKTIATALTLYRTDWNHLPLSDGVAGLGDSRGRTQFGNGPAANGYWNGVPNVLVDAGYIGKRKTLFCPSLAREYRNRAENLRYAYNTGAADSNGFIGSDGTPVDGVGAGGRTWLCRCVHLNSHDWAPDRYIPFPHGPTASPADNEWGSENVLWSDFSVTLEPGSSP